MFADRLFLLWRDLWEIHYVAGIVALGAVGFENALK